MTKAKTRAKIRMYRHGLGDCLLVRLPCTASADGWYNVMIDCGLLLGTRDAAAKMTAVVKDAATVTGGRLDLLAVTHEHWDHVSGFIQAKTVFEKEFTEIGAVWAAWTEDETDEQVQALKDGRTKALTALQASSTRLRAMGAAGSAEEVDGLLSFFGIGANPDGEPFAAAGGSTQDAVRTALKLGKTLRYCRPADAPFQPEGADWRIYVLGPPRDAVLLKKSDPSKRAPETYPLAAAAEGLVTALGTDDGRPFNRAWAIPLARTRELEFFQQTYHAADEAWRSIDRDWLGTTTELALKLDSDTNNTSLVLAIELPPATPDGEPDVLLFAADAQVGNWLSWQDLAWTVDGRTVTGPDLLKRTKVYKVGHHGSHNATLREKGLELMEGLQVALIPVDEAMAKTKRWDQMPRPSIIERLNAMVPNAVLRSDEDAAEQPWLTKDALYYEVTL